MFVHSNLDRKWITLLMHNSMQPVNIERGIAAIEAKLQDRKCLPHLLALARKHPEDINKYLSLAESIESDLSTRCKFSRYCFIY